MRLETRRTRQRSLFGLFGTSGRSLDHAADPDEAWIVSALGRRGRAAPGTSLNAVVVYRKRGVPACCPRRVPACCPRRAGGGSQRSDDAESLPSPCGLPPSPRRRVVVAALRAAVAGAAEATSPRTRGRTPVPGRRGLPAQRERLRAQTNSSCETLALRAHSGVICFSPAHTFRGQMRRDSAGGPSIAQSCPRGPWSRREGGSRRGAPRGKLGPRGRARGLPVVGPSCSRARAPFPSAEDAPWCPAGHAPIGTRRGATWPGRGQVGTKRQVAIVASGLACFLQLPVGPWSWASGWNEPGLRDRTLRGALPCPCGAPSPGACAWQPHRGPRRGWSSGRWAWPR